VSELFANYFETVVGLTTEELKKPNPFTALQISKELGFSSRNSLRR
jgi:phosphoglycolate phosphatase